MSFTALSSEMLKKTCISKTLFGFSILDIFKNVQNPFPFLLLGKNMSNYIYYLFFNLKKLIQILEIIYIIYLLKENITNIFPSVPSVTKCYSLFTLFVALLFLLYFTFSKQHNERNLLFVYYHLLCYITYDFFVVFTLFLACST
jgi:hypothetical protein